MDKKVWLKIAKVLSDAKGFVSDENPERTAEDQRETIADDLADLIEKVSNDFDRDDFLRAARAE